MRQAGPQPFFSSFNTGTTHRKHRENNSWQNSLEREFWRRFLQHWRGKIKHRFSITYNLPNPLFEETTEQVSKFNGQVCILFQLSNNTSETLCDSILKDLCHNISNLASFLEMNSTIRTTKLLVTTFTENSEWFKNMTIRSKSLVLGFKSSSGLRHHIYLRDGPAILKSLLSYTNNHELILGVKGSREWCHVMSFDIELGACRCALRFVKSSGDSGVSGKSAALNRIDSAIGCLRIFYSKFLPSLSASSFLFFSLQKTLLIFTECARRRHIMNSETLLLTSILSLGFLALGRKTSSRAGQDRSQN